MEVSAEVSAEVPAGSWCRSCGGMDCFTQEGLSATAIRLGYWRCLQCGSLVRPMASVLRVQPDTM